MKKLTLLLVILLSVPVIYAQTIVTTVPQCKNAILEEYTGIHCGYCPDGHKIAEAIHQANPTQVVLINIHQGSISNPSVAGDPDFRTIYGDSLANQAGVTGYPNGTINRHIYQKLGTLPALGRNTWSDAVKEITTLQSPVNAGITTSFDTSTRELTVNVELYYTLNSPASTNYINVALLENHVIGYQSDYAATPTYHNDYDHKHIMRHLITGQWGDKITQTTKGTVVTKTYKYIVPAKYVIGNCDVVVYVAESRQEIYTGVQASANGGSNDGTGKTFYGDLISSGTSFKKGLPSTETTFNFVAQNAFTSPLNFILKFSNDAPSGWTGSFTIDGNTYSDSVVVLMGALELKNVSIKATPGSTPGIATYNLTMKCLSDPNARTKSYEVNIISGITDLIVNNDAAWGNDGDTSASTYQQVFKDGLQYAGISGYTATSLSVFEKGSAANALQGIKNMYYNVGWSFPSLTDSNVAKFQSFLDNGGNLLISGQDIGWETFYTKSTFNTPNTKRFVNNYLKADWIDDGSTALNMLTAIPGESVFNVSGNSSLVNVYGKDPANGAPFMYPDIVHDTLNGQPIFYYNSDPTKIAGIRSNSSVYKTVYLAVSLEMISDASIRNQIMKLANDWFEGKIVSVEYDQKMADLMGQNYPNPASDYTRIPLTNVNRQMQLNLTDINGKVIKTIQIEKGSTSVTINCNDLSAGIYMCKLMDQNMTISTKRIVIPK
jgi:hypothetical protein